jgi:hypothetical protein
VDTGSIPGINAASEEEDQGLRLCDISKLSKSSNNEIHPSKCR